MAPRVVIRRVYEVLCDDCNENIADTWLDTYEEAKEERQAHIDWHRREG